MSFIHALALGVCLGLLPAAASAVAPTNPEPAMSAADIPQTTRLSNGLTILVMEDARFPLVSVRLYVHAGSAYETPEEAGISHVLEHMVFKGTEKRPKGEVAREVEAAGGYLNAATSFDYTEYLTDLPSKHWKLGLDVVRDMAFHPRLDPAELEAEKDVIVEEIKRGKDSPGSLLFENMQAACLPGTPYARPIIGFERTVRNVSADNIRAYIRKHYQPQSMLLVVVGDVRADDVLADAKTRFGGYANRDAVIVAPPLDAAALRPGSAGTLSPVIAGGPWNKVYLSLAVPVPGINDVRANRLDVLARLLGGDQTSLFWRRYKYERGLVDSIHASNLSFERTGALYVTAELDADKVGPFWEALTADLARLTAGDFTDEDIARAKLGLEDDLLRARETLSGLASKLGSFQFLTGDGIMGERNAIATLRAVNREQIAECITDWLLPERLSLVMLRPQDERAFDSGSLTAVLRKNWPAKDHNAAGRAEAGKPGEEVIKLGEGRTLVLIPDATLPYASANLSFAGGDSLLRPDQQGLAALAARVLTRGTGGTNPRDAMALQSWLGDRAAALVAGAGRRSFSLTLTAPSAFAGDLFALLRETVNEPALAAPETEREKQSQLALIRSRDDQPLSYAFRRLPAFLFPGSVFGYYQLGRAEDIPAYTEKDVRAFWDKQRGRSWVLSVAGGYDREAVLAAAKSLSLPKPNAGETRIPAPDWNKEHALDLRLPGRQQAHYLLLFKTVPMDHPDAPGLDLLQNILAGQSGLLFSDLRDDKGLGYTVTAISSSNPEFGYLAFYIGTTPDKLDEAQAGFERVLERLHNELLPGEAVERGKNQMEGEYYRKRQSLGSRADEAASLTLIGKPLSFARDHIARAAACDAAALQTLARAYLKLAGAYSIRLVP